MINRFIRFCLITCYTLFLFSPFQTVIAKDSETLLKESTTLIQQNISLEEIEKKTTELKYIDEVLTSSVLSYAFSGDEKWLLRYNEFEPKLTKIINDLLALQSIEDVNLIDDLDKYNRALVELEVKATELVKAGERQSAMALIGSPIYQQNKTQYMTALLKFAHQIKQRIKEQPNNGLGNSASLQLTPEELAWIAENEVIVGVEHWPPILFMQEDNIPGGLSGEILRQIVEKTGLNLKYVSGSWNEVLTQFKQGKIDLLPDAYLFEDRKEFGYFSEPYFIVRELFYVKDSNTRFQTNLDLSSGTIAISQGYTTVEKVRKLYPDIKILETSGLQASIDSVLSGKADALLDAQVAVNDWIEQKNIQGLRVIDEDVIYPPSLHLFSAKKSPLLHSILQKGLDSLKVSDLMRSNNDWLSSRNNTHANTQDTSDDIEQLAWLIVGLVILLVLFGTLISSLVLRTSEKKLAEKFSSSKFKKTILSGLIALSIVLILIAAYVVDYAKKQHYETLEYSLNTLLATTHQRLDVWVQYELNMLEQLGKNNELSELVSKLLVVPTDKEFLIQSPLQSQIRQFFKEREGDFGDIGFFIISPEKISLSSRRDTNVGSVNVIEQTRPELLAKVLDGQSVFIPPIHSDIAVNESGGLSAGKAEPTMFFAAPVINDSNQVIAIVTKRVNFDGGFFSILSAGFIGKSGEIYALDKSGLLLSNVRFENDLRDIGLIAEKERASLHLTISDPGESLLGLPSKIQQEQDWPLTLMAQNIATGKSGINLEGYRDYRGVKVIGSWLWDDLIGVGLAAEVDAEEALALLTIFKYTLWSILFIALVLIFGSTLFTLKVGTRATKALSRSHNELETLVNERTKALEANMKRTRSIIDTASDGIIVVNEQGIIQEFGPAAEIIFGYSINEVIEQPVDMLMKQDFHEKLVNNQESGQKEQTTFQLIGVKKDRQLIDIEVAVGEAWLDNERIFTGIVRDISLRIKKERELKKAKAEADEATKSLEKQAQLQQLLIDSVPIPLFYKDSDAKFKGFNKAYEEVFGVKSADLVGLKVIDLAYLPEEDRLAYQAEDEAVIAQQKHIKKEIKISFADGKEHDTLYWVSGYADSQNKPAGLVGSFIDISNEKETARRLEIAVKSADEATQAKSDFLANMSHEIRTPMNAIIGMSYLALQTNLNRKQADYVKKIHSSADALLGIINDILDFSKIEAGKLELEEIPFNLNETIDHLVQIISHKSQQKELELLIDIDPELPLDLVGDSLRLGQILINLANNSIKFTDEGEIVVRAKLIAQKDKRVTIQFSICDSGIGMTDEQVSRLFQSFSQADASTTRKYGGTGLGLTISKTLTEMMKGKIWVESTYGEGSIFHFTSEFGLADSAVTQPKQSASSLRDLPVLIVDDSLAAREILFNLSESLGFAPDVAPSGEEALEKVITAEGNGSPFKLILADWRMPKMDGIELAERILNTPKITQVPKFVIVTAYDRDDMLKQAQHVPLASSITKPVSASTLLDTTLKVMEGVSNGHGTEQNNKLDMSATEGIFGAEILLVEDNEINQQIASELLEMAGLNVSVAENGQIALQRIETQNFDAVLMDLQMPVMDGYTATKAIRKQDKYDDLPIIAMTANAMSGDREKCLAAGMNDHLAKPIDPQEVFKTLAHWIKPTGKSNNVIAPLQPKSDELPIPQLNDFDVTTALTRVAGNIKAYRSMLKKVLNSENDAIERIRHTISEKDFKSAVIIAHTIKGVSGNIGANFVIAEAEKLEHGLGDHLELKIELSSQEIDVLIDACEKQHNKMIAAITEELKKEEQASESVTYDENKVKNLMRTLSSQIDCFDSMASETIQDLLECFDESNKLPAAKLLDDAMLSYDFEQAETFLTELELQIGQYSTDQEATKIDNEALTARLEEIAQQIDNFDSTVVDTVDELLDLSLEHDIHQSLEKVRDALSEYDFDAGDAILKQINIS